MIGDLTQLKFLDLGYNKLSVPYIMKLINNLNNNLN